MAKLICWTSSSVTKQFQRSNRNPNAGDNAAAVGVTKQFQRSNRNHPDFGIFDAPGVTKQFQRSNRNPGQV